MKRALLALADGTVFEGRSFGAEGEATGEVVFNTSMTGYQEILTDPSYKGQIVVMTYPLIGNYGVNEEDLESRRPFVEGFVVKEASPYPSNWRNRKSLDEYLKEFGIVGIQGIDTRALTKHIRDHGAQEGVISTVDLSPESLVEKARSSPGLIGRDLVKEVTCTEPYTWDQPEWRWPYGYQWTGDRGQGTGVKPQLDLLPPHPSPFTPHMPYRVVAFDCGIKYNILRRLTTANCQVTVVPAQTPAEEVLKMKPDGLFLSNGPGDPEGVPYVIETVRALIGRKPIFGICLGHQILALAMGAKTYKLKFGHHGGNQPVKDLLTGKVQITVQNHGFAVDMDSFKDVPGGEEIILTHLNLDDGTCEGLMHRRLPLFSVQYHPEASPGPHDAAYLFKWFVKLMERERRSKAASDR